MPRTDWSLQDAKNSFSSVVAAAQKGVPQTVSKRGRPAVVVLSVEEYRRLRGQGAGAAPSFVDMLLAMPQDDGAFEHAPVTPRDIDF